MVSNNIDVDDIVLVYRIFSLHYGFKIDTLLEFRALIRAINIQHIKDWCGLVIEDDLVLIDDEILDICKKSIKEKPILSGSPDREENEDGWGEWGGTSEADRKTFEKISRINWWEGIDNLIILETKWEDYVDSESLGYFYETKYNRFVFWFNDDYETYKNEIKRRRIQEIREYKLDSLI